LVGGAGPGELRTPLVGQRERLVRVVSLNQFLGQTVKRVAPDHAEGHGSARARAQLLTSMLVAALAETLGPRDVAYCDLICQVPLAVKLKSHSTWLSWTAW
jgi:hypothetical protein